ncbi:MAG: hypothetical protein U5J82_15875 [Desulfobacterales bacterium]|nr:hypothetical protein [Desulfobacterales bacterium]
MSTSAGPSQAVAKRYRTIDQRRGHGRPESGLGRPMGWEAAAGGVFRRQTAGRPLRPDGECQK